MDVLSVLVTKQFRFGKYFARLFFILLFSIGGFAVAKAMDEAVAQEIDLHSNSLLDTGGPDEYGYLWDDSVPYNWKDPSGATAITFNNLDNAFAGPFNLGFSFPFYENAYNQVYVSTNGLLTFGSGGSYASNREIPHDLLPNDLIAPLWKNLYVDGAVSYMTGNDGNGPYFAVNYVDVTHDGESLTFQVILYQSGDIWFQYNDLNGNLSEAVVGIEDGDGLDGLAYGPALHNTLAIRFQRPGNTARVKNLPQYDSRLAQFGQYDFVLFIRNTGEVGTDVYDLTAAFVPGEGNAAWTTSFWRVNNNQNLVPLEDTDFDGIPDTGGVLQGETIPVTVRLESPNDTMIVGQFTTFKVTSKSSLDTSKTSETIFQTAVPARHFLALGNSAGLDLARISSTARESFDVTSLGSNPSLVRNGLHYFYTWEYDDFNPGTDIEYVVLGYSGRTIKPITKLTDNESVSPQTFDSSPYTAVAPNGRVAIVWIRRIFDPGPPFLGQNDNIYFAILDAEGNILTPPTNVTNNDNWQDGDNINVPTFLSPVVLATKDNRFILGWIDDRLEFSGKSTDIGYVVYDTDGDQFQVPDELKNGFADGEQYGEPKFLELPGDRLFVTYSAKIPPPSNEIIPAFEVFSIAPDSLGDGLQIQTFISGAKGRNTNGIMLDNGNMLVAWTNSQTGQIQYALFADEGDSVSQDSGTINLSNPDGRSGDLVSITISLEGYGILSWVENEPSSGNRIYYALIDQSGNVLSPPVYSWVDNESIVFSRSGQSLASVPDFVNYLPIITRKGE